MRACLLLFALLVGLPAFAARSLAVLPLDQGAKSDTHEGLGRALAGMLVSDLSRVEELELVERSRLDVLLKEIELGDSGFLDPKTAAKLGSGVGAEWVVIGSWSVVGETFLMDTRAVEVKSGKIVAAVDANGKIDDFITVEKTLVEDLLLALKIAVSAGARRKIIAEAPTEDFQAMTTYAAGLQAEFDGRYEDARKRFEEAAKRDPAFELPFQGLAKVKANLEKLETERRTEQVDARTQQILDALAKSPDEMTLTGRTSDPEVLGQLAVRWSLLETTKRHCQLTSELRHYIERHKGKVTKLAHPIPYNHRHWAAYDLGLYEKRPEIWNNGTVSPGRNGFSTAIDRAPSPSFLPNLVVGITDGIDRAEEIGGSLLNETVACAGGDPNARVSALEDLLAFLRKYGIAEMTTYENSKRPVWTEVEVMLLQAMASRDGMSEAVQQRSFALMELETGKEDDDYAIRSDVGKVAKVAARTQVWLSVSDGLAASEIERVGAAALAGDASVLAVDHATCKVLIPQLAHTWKRFVEDREKPHRQSSLAWTRIDLAASVNGLTLAGCVHGTKGRLATLADALAWVDTMPARSLPGRPEDCEKTSSDVADQMKSYRAPNPAIEDHFRGAVIAAGMRVIRGGCATLR